MNTDCVNIIFFYHHKNVMNNILNELKNNNKFKENSEYSCVYGKCDICKINLRISDTKNKKKLLYRIKSGVNDICLGCLIISHYY